MILASVTHHIESNTLARHISTIKIKVDPMLGMMPDADW